MSEIFTQRRILGLLILALACMLTIGWIKTLASATIDNKPPEPTRIWGYRILLTPLVLASAFLLIVNRKKPTHRKLIENDTSSPN